MLGGWCTCIVLLHARKDDGNSLNPHLSDKSRVPRGLVWDTYIVCHPA